jgi:hypothetical protein
MEEKNYEYLDNSVRGSANCLAWRVHSFSRGGRIDPPAACIRRNFPHLTFCDGSADSVEDKVKQRDKRVASGY